jgi:hypothetical protein
MILSMKDSSKTICTMDGEGISTIMVSTGDFSKMDSDMAEASGWQTMENHRMEIGIWDSSSDDINAFL